MTPKKSKVQDMSRKQQKRKKRS